MDEGATEVLRPALDLDVERLSEEFESSFRGSGRLGRRRIAEVLSLVNERGLLEPLALCRRIRVLRIYTDRIDLGDDEPVKAPLLARRLKGASELMLGMVTIGPSLPRLTQSLFAAGQPHQALIAETIGYHALQRCSDHLRAHVEAMAARSGQGASGSLSPGHTGFDLRYQAWLAESLEAERHGIRVTSSFMLQPILTLSLVYGLGSGLTSWSQQEHCEHCQLGGHCRFRRQATDPGRGCRSS